MLKKTTKLIPCLAFFLLGTACSKKTTPVEEALETQTLLVGIGGDPQSLDPHVAVGAPGKTVIWGLFEGLLTQHPQNLPPVPGVAESWDVSADGKTYTFFLRENARWSNGDAVTAHDFVFSYERILSKELGAPQAYSLFIIKNAQAYYDKALTDFTKVGVTALDEHTLEIELNNPTPYFLDLLIQSIFFPVHKATILKYGDPKNPNNPWTRPGHLVSNGPFMLKSRKTNDEIIATKNPLYWDAEHVRLNEIHFLPMSVEAEEHAFRAGQLHLTYWVPEAKAQKLLEQKSPELVSEPALIVYHYCLNTRRPPLDDKRVRKALSLAIDREKITKAIILSQGKPAYNFVPYEAGNFISSAPVKEDIEEAKNLLAEAGYPNGEGFPPIEILYNTAETHRKVAEAIQEMWHENLNINALPENQEWKVLLARRNTKDFQIVRTSWIAHYVDPNALLELYRSDSSVNESGWENAQYDALIKQAATERNPSKRRALMQEAEALLLDEAPVIPISFYNMTQLKHPSVRGWYPNLLCTHPYNDIYLQAPK